MLFKILNTYWQSISFSFILFFTILSIFSFLLRNLFISFEEFSANRDFCFHFDAFYGIKSFLLADYYLWSEKNEWISQATLIRLANHENSFKNFNKQEYKKQQKWQKKGKSKIRNEAKIKEKYFVSLFWKFIENNFEFSFFTKLKTHGGLSIGIFKSYD